MIKDIERLTVKLASLDMETVQALYDKRRAVESERQKGAEQYLIEQGYERVFVDDEAFLTEDGREIIRLAGQAWALLPRVHEDRRERAIAGAQLIETQRRAAEQESNTKSVVGTEALSALVCPKCGDSLQYSAVCPKCTAGQRGFRHSYVCVCGAIEIISVEAL